MGRSRLHKLLRPSLKRLTGTRLLLSRLLPLIGTIRRLLIGLLSLPPPPLSPSPQAPSPPPLSLKTGEPKPPNGQPSRLAPPPTGLLLILVKPLIGEHPKRTPPWPTGVKVTTSDPIKRISILRNIQ